MPSPVGTGFSLLLRVFYPVWKKIFFLATNEKVLFSMIPKGARLLTHFINSIEHTLLILFRLNTNNELKIFEYKVHNYFSPRVIKISHTFPILSNLRKQKHLSKRPLSFTQSYLAWFRIRITISSKTCTSMRNSW